MRLLHAKQSLESAAVDLFCTLPKTKAGNRFILVIGDRLTKMTQVVPLKRTTGLDFAKEFRAHWDFKYGAPKDVLSNNGPQFAKSYTIIYFGPSAS